MRGWTRAYGVMLGQEWPQQIPEIVRKQYDFEQLDDREQPPLPLDIAVQAQKYAETNVADLKYNLFPIHGLAGLA